MQPTQMDHLQQRIRSHLLLVTLMCQRFGDNSGSVSDNEHKYCDEKVIWRFKLENYVYL